MTDVRGLETFGGLAISRGAPAEAAAWAESGKRGILDAANTCATYAELAELAGLSWDAAGVSDSAVSKYRRRSTPGKTPNRCSAAGWCTPTSDWRCLPGPTDGALTLLRPTTVAMITVVRTVKSATRAIARAEGLRRVTNLRYSGTC
jgi:hypothetical protein